MGQPVPETLLISKKDAAKAFGISVTALGQWPIKPSTRAGRVALYYLPELIEYRLNRGQSGQGGSYEEERTRLTKAQADKTELEVAQLKGQLLNVDGVAEEMADVILAARAKLLALPGRLAAQAIAATNLREIEDFAREEIDSALRELGSLEAGAVAGADMAVMETPAAADSRRMGRAQQTS